MSDFDDQFGTHVLEPVFQFDFFGNGYAVFGDRRSTKGFVDDYVATGRPHGYGHSVRQFLDAAKHAISSMILEEQLFSHDEVPCFDLYLKERAISSLQLNDLCQDVRLTENLDV